MDSHRSHLDGIVPPTAAPRHAALDPIGEEVRRTLSLPVSLRDAVVAETLVTLTNKVKLER